MSWVDCIGFCASFAVLASFCMTTIVPLRTFALAGGDVLATIEHNDLIMKILAVISILALLTITGAAYTDQLLTSDQQTAQRGN